MFSFSLDFQHNYNHEGCQIQDSPLTTPSLLTVNLSTVAQTVTTAATTVSNVNLTTEAMNNSMTTIETVKLCLRENSLLFLLLTLGTLWLGLTLFNFTKT